MGTKSSRLRSSHKRRATDEGLSTEPPMVPCSSSYSSQLKSALPCQVHQIGCQALPMSAPVKIEPVKGWLILVTIFNIFVRYTFVIFN